MEWMDEPDREEFDYAGLKCLILRHPELKHLNGYVALLKKETEITGRKAIGGLVLIAPTGGIWCPK